MLQCAFASVELSEPRKTSHWCRVWFPSWEMSRILSFHFIPPRLLVYLDYCSLSHPKCISSPSIFSSIHMDTIELFQRCYSHRPNTCVQWRYAQEKKHTKSAIVTPLRAALCSNQRLPKHARAFPGNYRSVLYYPIQDLANCC
jgi:hypothetical protein